MREKCVDDPVFLAKFVAELAEPGFVFKESHADWMRFVTEPPQPGKQALRMLLAPRTHGKSTVANLCATIWWLLKDPDIRILIGSNTDLQAEGFVKHLKRVLEHPAFVAQLGDLRGDIWKTHELSVKGSTSIRKEANVTALGMGAAIPSRHFDVVLLDDIIDEDNAATEGQREKARNWYFETLEPTLVREGIVVVIGTRWHYYDLYGQLIEAGGFDVRRYKAVLNWSERQDLWDEYAEMVTSENPEDVALGRKILDDNRKAMMAGTEVLLPEVWTYETLMEKRARSTRVVFNKQYQNEPQLGGEERIFKETDFRYFDEDDSTIPSRDDMCCVVTAWDLAISLKERSDFTAWVTIGATLGGMYYVLDSGRGKMTMDAQLTRIESLWSFHRDDKVRVESVQYQAAVPQLLKRWTNIPVEEYHPSRDKGARAMGVQPQVENHRVLFNRKHRVLLRELCEFPFSEHDDLFDAFVMALDGAVELAGKIRKRGKKKSGRYFNG